jgi:hypothetical protein
MRMTIMVAILLVSCGLMGCSKVSVGPAAGAPPPTPPITSATGSTRTCPYAGAIVSATYRQRFDLAKIRVPLLQLGWVQTSMEGDSAVVIAGRLNGSAIGASISGDETDLGVHLFGSGDVADYPKESVEAEKMLRQVTVILGKTLDIHPEASFARQINWGCEG